MNQIFILHFMLILFPGYCEENSNEHDQATISLRRYILFSYAKDKLSRNLKCLTKVKTVSILPESIANETTPSEWYCNYFKTEQPLQKGTALTLENM